MAEGKQHEYSQCSGYRSATTTSSYSRLLTTTKELPIEPRTTSTMVTGTITASTTPRTNSDTTNTAAADIRTMETGTMTTTTTEGTTTAIQIMTITAMMTTTAMKAADTTVKEDMNVDGNKMVITTNTHEEYFNARSNEEKMETMRNFQNRLGANRYAAFSDDNDDDWNTHVPQYEKREEKPRRMRANEKASKGHAPKGEETNRYLPYGTLVSNVANKRNAQPRLENTTKGNATDIAETNRFSQRRLSANRNAIEQSSFSANQNGGAVSTDKYPTDENRGVIPIINVGNIRIIPTGNDIPTENNEK